MKVISIGEVLWDIFDTGEHLGGAPLNLAVHAARLGHEVFLVSAVGDDARGKLTLTRIEEAGVATDFVQQVTGQATGTATVALDVQGQPHFAIQRPAAYDYVNLAERDLERLASRRPGWICYGTLFQTNPNCRALTERIFQMNPRARRFCDVNLRAGFCSPVLVKAMLLHADVVKINEEEACALGGQFGWQPGSLEQFCRRCAAEFCLESICVTLGPRGCALLNRREYVEVDGFPVRVADPVGAGDAFAATFLHGIHNGWPPAKIGELANRVGAIVASRDGAVPPWTLEEVAALDRAVDANRR